MLDPWRDGMVKQLFAMNFNWTYKSERESERGKQEESHSQRLVAQPHQWAAANVL